MYCKKFPFFDEDNYEDQGSETNLANVQPADMFAFDQVVFMSCKYKKKNKDNQSIINEPLILKIYKNKILDEYKPFNKIIYFFRFLSFENKHYFVCCGMDFFDPKKLINMQQPPTIMMTTSIKIFSAEKFIDKNHKVENSDINVEPYLIKQINLLRSCTDHSKYIIAKDIPKNCETVENIISFGLSADLKNISIGLDHGTIVLVTGYPELANTADKNLKIKNLEPINTDLHITNLCFTTLQDGSIILYASTTKQLFFYKINDKGENLYILNPDSGAYSNCIDPKADRLLMATSMDNQIMEYLNLEMGPSFFFEGKKQMACYYKNYIAFVVIEDKSNIIAIYDKNNSFFSYFNNNFTKVSCIAHDGEYLFAFVEINYSNKKIIKLKEKDNKYKFEIFYKRSFFDNALKYATNLNYDNKKIAEIHQRHGDFIYAKGDYEKAIEQYILTINFLDPNYVIQKFLDGSKLDYLILYLEALHKENNFNFRCKEEMKDYTALLLNCYIKQKQIMKLKEFVEGKELTPQLLNVETAIEVCKDTNQIDLALSIAEKSKMFDKYIQLLIDYKRKYLLYI